MILSKSGQGQRGRGGRRGWGVLTPGPPNAKELKMTKFGNLAFVLGLDEQN